MATRRISLYSLPFRRRFSDNAGGKSYIRTRLDFKALSADVDAYQNVIRRRNVDADAALVADLYEKKILSDKHIHAMRARRNTLAKTMKSKDVAPDDRKLIIEEGRQIKKALDESGVAADALDLDLQQAAARIPNRIHARVPEGETPVVLDTIGSQDTLPYNVEGFEPLDHVELCTRHDLLDFGWGAKVAGSQMYFLKKEAALLELALANWTLQRLVQEGFTPVIPPDVVDEAVVGGCGFQPRNREGQQLYQLQDSPLCLSGTSEIALAGSHGDRILAAEELPIKLAAFSHCFRTEIGSGGLQTRGLYRVHQFGKVEMFVFSNPEESEQQMDELVRIQKQLYSELGLHYQVLEMPANDLGAPAACKVDMEAWLPCHNGGCFGEISSTSNCLDYQARRLNIRYRPYPTAPTEFVHTLNGTAAAVPRLIIAILEQFQRADGSVTIPEALRPFMMGASSIPSGAFK